MITKRLVYLTLMTMAAGIVLGSGPALAENAGATFYVT
jgi:hypothetical protein